MNKQTKTIIEHKKIPRTCMLCKTKFDAEHIMIRNGIQHPSYNDSNLSMKIRKDTECQFIYLKICPECAEKLLELLDKHFPRLNLEDEV